jgi:hypothetical protein
MTKSDIPTPICATCGESGSKSYTKGETSHLCQNCGTEMRYMPAGELLKSGGNAIKENNGWVMSFSVRSSELYSGRAMFVLGILILILTISFLWLGKIGSDAALWSSGSGILLSIIGKRKTIMQKKKTQMTLDRYPYWKK